MSGLVRTRIYHRAPGPERSRKMEQENNKPNAMTEEEARKWVDEHKEEIDKLADAINIITKFCKNNDIKLTDE